MNTWIHPTFGTLKFRDYGRWEGSLPRPPAFAQFKGDQDSDVAFCVNFESTDGKTPSPEAIALAERVLANLASLALRIPQSLFGDFSGKGPTSGYWWHNSLMTGEFAEVAEIVDVNVPQSAAEVVPLLCSTGLTIYEFKPESHGPVAELTFWSWIEAEHCIGIITDGGRILGQGYQGDMQFFLKP